MDLPDPAHEPDSFASIMLGIDWIEDIQIQVAILHQVSSRTQGFQSLAHPNVTSSHYLLVLSWNRRQQRKKDSDQFLVSTQVQSYALLHQGFGT